MRACALAALALLGLCGCQGKSPEAAESRIPPTLAQRFYPPDGWTWGRLTVGAAAPLRYGVAAAPHSAKAEVLIIPDAGEPAEAWFETSRDLLSHDVQVWVMDLPGQGGSARAPGVADRLYATSLDPYVAATQAMVDQVVRPRARGAPLILVGDGLGGQIALRVLSGGSPDVAGAVIGAPALSPRPVALARPFGDWGAAIALKVGLDRPFVAGEHRWNPPPHASRDRDGVVAAWLQANPDLRIGGASLAWSDAYNRSAALARNPDTLVKATLPLAMVSDQGDGAARAVCSAAKACRFTAVGGGQPHLAPDAVRGPWLKAMLDFIAAREAGRSVAAPPPA